MEVLKIKGGKSEYDVLVGRGLLQSVPGMLKNAYPGSRFAVITDYNVWGYYGKQFLAALSKEGVKYDVLTVEPGESSKSIDTYAGVLSRLATLYFSRSDIIVALGGGVIGDLAGFAAATYLRGIKYIQVPTTLLAQIDSSVGGKTAVNLPEGKNLAGAFYHPSAVYIDTEVLKTLREQDFADGMAEMIKYALIKDKTMLDVIGRKINADSPELDDLIMRCLSIKRDVVAADERDVGERMVLNFGHTIGHALERVCAAGGGHITHGQAVARGMAAIATISEREGHTAKGTAAFIVQLLRIYGLPCCLGGFDRKEILEGIFVDKKNLSDRLNLILLKEPGTSFIHPVSRDEMADYLLKD
jgi:3-dehydroquinate synthase